METFGRLILSTVMFLFGLLSPCNLIAQYDTSVEDIDRLLRKGDIVLERGVQMDVREGRIYSNLVYVKFEGNVFENDLSLPVERMCLLDAGLCDFLLNDIGVKFVINKTFKKLKYGDIYRENIVTGKMVRNKDLSQVATFLFEELVSLDILPKIESYSIVEVAGGPVWGIPSGVVPNDPNFSLQWELGVISASKAWDITKGVGLNGPIEIAFLDLWDQSQSVPHDDLIGKLYNQHGDYGGHGQRVAGMAGAKTDNNSHGSSLGWEVQLRGYDYLDGLASMEDALDDGFHILNVSMELSKNFLLDSLFYNALNRGIVVVSGAGNNNFSVPRVAYPAAYYFSDIDRQVIAVSATDDNDEFVDEYVCGATTYTSWNYSVGSNPISDPVNSFVDVAAPGRPLYNLTYYDTDEIVCGGGTSFSAPLVSALAALILSINENLTSADVYDIIVTSAEKVGIDSYNYGVDSKGWNTKLGYGRINAYEALKYTIENYGATVPEGETMRLYDDAFEMAPGASITVYGELVIEDAEIEANGSPVIHFKPGSTGTITGSTISGSSGANATALVYIENAKPDIIDSEIENTYGNRGYAVYVVGADAEPWIHQSVLRSADGPVAYLDNLSLTWLSESSFILPFNDGGAVIFVDGAQVNFATRDGLEGVYGVNYIKGGNYGIHATGSGAAVYAGVDPFGPMFNENSFCDSGSSNIRASYSASVWIDWNYWAIISGSFYGPVEWEDNGGAVFYNNYKLGVANCSGVSKAAALFAGLQGRPLGDANTLAVDLNSARLDGYRKFLREGDYLGAQEELLQVFESFDAASQKVLLSEFVVLFRKSRSAALTGFLQSLVGEPSLRLETATVLVMLHAIADEHDRALGVIRGHESVHDGGLWSYLEALVHFDRGEYESAAGSFSRIRGTEVSPEVGRRALALHRLLQWAEPSLTDKMLNFQIRQVGGSAEAPPLLKKPAVSIENFPNPFNPTTTLRISLADALPQAEVRVYDTVGRTVLELHSGPLGAGAHEFHIDASKLATGMYLVRVQAGRLLTAHKILLKK